MNREKSQNMPQKNMTEKTVISSSESTNLQSSTEVTLDKVVQMIDEVKKETSTEMMRQVQTDKASLITVFGVFASIISFLTIEFQFLRTICSFEKLIGFTIILASLLLCFNIALDYLVKSRIDKETPMPNMIFTIFVLALFVLGIVFMYRGNEEKCKDNKIYEKYLENFENQQVEFNENYLNAQNKKYNEINDRITGIEKQIKK